MTVTAAVNAYTATYRFSLINFDYPRWHTEDWKNWQLLDATLKTLGAIASQGVWANNTAYIIGDRVVDTVNGSIYVCAVNHTSAASGIFSADRTANPTYWTIFTSVPNYRGSWAAGVSYSVGDIVVLNNTTWYFCQISHTSSGTFALDVARWVTVFDLSFYNNLYYGARASETNFRPNGTPSQAGDVYYNTTLVALRLYTGATWVNYNSSSVAASGVTFTPTGNIAATNVQAALAEVDSEKADAAAVTTSLAGKANTVHTHAITDVTGLSTALADRAMLSTSGTFAQIMTFSAGLAFDANFTITLSGGNPLITLESGRTLSYDRATDTMTSNLDWLFTTTGRIRIPVGTTAQRITPVIGDFRYNTTVASAEIYNGTVWTGLGGATGAGGDQIFYENGQTVTTDYTIAATKNAMSAGPITINSGITVTISTGATWVVV